MRAKQAGLDDKLCDTVAHKLGRPSASSLQDARAVKSGRALQGALLSLLERKPLEHITVRDITAEAGVHYATFFRHHPAKEALLDHVAADQINRLVELTMPVMDAVDSRAAFGALCLYVDDHRTLWTALLTGGAAGTMREELLRLSLEVAADRAPKESWLPIELGVISTVTTIVESLAWWLRQPPGAYSVERMAKILYRLVLASTTEIAMED